ncbi:MAG TPA: pilus assembly protein TadG-related protein [Bryobacteraceae bacterium]
MSAGRSQKGFVLIVTCIVLAILMALAGLGIDIGRMYVIKSELQAFADAAALNAAIQLDGTDQGLARARIAAAELAAGPNAMKWDMGTQPIADITVTFAKGTVRVVASAPATLIFLRAFQALNADFATVSAAGVAGKIDGNVRLLQ